jgi:hypothetical protein
MAPASRALVALVLLTLSGVAQAAPDAPVIAVRLQLKAGDCVSSAELIDRVHARSPRIQFVEDVGAPTVRVSFAVSSSGSVASELELNAPGANLPQRRLVASSCADAADAVALIIAISLDPLSATHARSADGEPPSTGDSATKRADAPASAPAPTPSTPPPKALSEQPRAAPPADRAAPAQRRFSAQLAAQTLLGPAPGVLPGIGIYATAALDREGLWSPALVLGFVHTWRKEIAEPGGKASFTLDAASVDACALRVQMAAFEGRACGSALLGRLASQGSATNEPASRARPFAVAGAATVLTIRLSASFELSARTAAGATLVRDSFKFSPIVFHTAAPVTLEASLGIAVRTP